VLFGLRLRRASTSESETHGDGPHDGELIARANRGELDAFNILVSRHERAVYSVALRYLRSPQLAEDVTQDTFIRAWQAIDSFRNDTGEGFRAWLLRIASNRALDVLRARARRPADSLDARVDDEDTTWEPESGDEDALAFTTRDELGQRLERALGQIQPDQRLVVLLSDVHGHAYDEIAAITGLPLGTVKSRINRGRAKLREVLLADDTSRELLGRYGRLDSSSDRG
jgi:RNA polymerase sigma-70 factor (ECF subfamily)